DAREEAPAAQGQAVRQAGRLDESLLDADGVVGLESEREIAVERLVDIGVEVDLALIDREAARQRPSGIAERESRQAIGVGIAALAGGLALEHRADRRVEGAGARWRAAGTRGDRRRRRRLRRGNLRLRDGSDRWRRRCERRLLLCGGGFLRRVGLVFRRFEAPLHLLQLALV